MLDMSVRAKILGLLETLKHELVAHLRLHHARPGLRPVLLRPHRHHVPGQDRRDRPDRRRSSTTRGIRTRRRCCEAVPDPDPSRGVARDLPRGEIPDAAAPPLGCSFHPRCPRAFAPCGWEARDVRMILEERWTHIPADQCDDERALIGEIGASAAETVVLTSGPRQRGRRVDAAAGGARRASGRAAVVGRRGSRQRRARRAGAVRAARRTAATPGAGLVGGGLVPPLPPAGGDDPAAAMSSSRAGQWNCGTIR